MNKNRVPVRFTGQHFIIDTQLIEDSIRLAEIQKNDLVLDIGAGRGFLTGHLVRYSGNVIAIESDPGLVAELRTRFAFNKNITVVNSDFRKFRIPQKQFKVVSNIPYGITSCILRSLMYNNTEFFEKGSLVIQLDAAQKLFRRRVFNPYVLFYHTFYDLELIYTVPPASFMPPPTVQSALVKISKKQSPRINIEMKEKYFDFLCFILKYPDLSVRTALKKIFRKRQIREFSHKYGLKLDDVVTLLLPEQSSDCFIEMLRVVPDKFHPEN
ncbi:23S rRNA (adenine-N6)-dimethyltransferase [Porphyromonadaceae bacterium KH3CP3RA]|nr:23S rRNA (adenine-N6)-dimethyltransferase [Porphyromonadaceae bacterium KH3CP3RA]